MLWNSIQVIFGNFPWGQLFAFDGVDNFFVTFIEILEDKLGVKAIKDFQPIQPGDVEATAANTNILEEWIDFEPSISIELGIEKFANWYLDYYKN